ncbi:MAG TPA: MoaD/ThiS family protein [Candidatus Binatia bacterium]
MTIRVLFFAYLRERCGAERRLELPEGASVGEALGRLREQYPVLADASLRVALNRVYVDNADPLHDNDELALIPPVSGGSPSAGTEKPTPCT